jgi:S1-C subfamily serine protease
MTGPMFPPPPPPAQQPPRGPSRGPSRAVAIVAAIGALAAAAVLAAVGINQVASLSTSGRAFTARPTATSNGGSGSASGNVDSQAIAAKVDPAVVDINTTLANGQGEAAGTGMVLTSSGEVLTNNHVIANSSDIRVTIGGTGRAHSASVLGYNVTDDVALLKVDGVSGLKTVDTTTNVSVGEPIVALGNALGQGGTPDAKTGTVTALGRNITVSDETGSNQQTLNNLIQIDAGLQPGDSGGPLVDSNGQVIGMDAAASSGRFRFESGSTGGEGYAVPMKTALAVAHQIESGTGSGDTHIGDRAFLGVAIRDAETSGGFPGRGGSSSGGGAVVQSVQSGSPADNVGLQAGDEIVALGGKNVSSLSDLTSALAQYHPHDKASISWVDSDGSHHAGTVTLTSGPPA